MPLIVCDPSRLSRNEDDLEKAIIGHGLKVISVVDGGELPVGILRERVRAAAQVARRSAEGTREALSRKNRPYPADIVSARQKAAQESSRARIAKKFLVLDQVVDFLEARPGLVDETSSTIADALNGAGIMTGWSKPWTASAVRYKLKQVRNELEFRREMGEEEESGDEVDQSSVSAPEVEQHHGRQTATRTAQCNDGQPFEHIDHGLDPDELELRSDPDFGIF